MSLEAFEITINKPVNKYSHRGGERLAGNVKILVSGDSMRAQEVNVKVLGVATTSWTSYRTEYDICYNPGCSLSWHQYDTIYYNRHCCHSCNSWNYYGNSCNHGHGCHHHASYHYHPYTVRVNCSNQETFFSHEIKLLNEDQRYLDAGETNFLFSCDLPDDLPSSVFNHISYTVEATIVKPWYCWTNETRTAAFRVFQSLDLNSHPELLEPQTNTAEKIFCSWFWWCKSGPLTLVLKLPVSGAVIGDELQPVVEIDNASNVNIKNVTLSLVREDNYLYHYSVLKSLEVIFETQLGPVQADSSTMWDQNQLPIPYQLPRSLWNGGVVINTKYYVKVTCVPSGLHQEISVDLPVVVGTIPFKNEEKHSGLFKHRKN